MFLFLCDCWVSNSDSFLIFFFIYPCCYWHSTQNKKKKCINPFKNAVCFRMFQWWTGGWLITLQFNRMLKEKSLSLLHQFLILSQSPWTHSAWGSIFVAETHCCTFSATLWTGIPVADYTNPALTDLIATPWTMSHPIMMVGTNMQRLYLL